MRPFVPSWSARYEELRAAEHVRRALRFSSADPTAFVSEPPLPGAPLIFWSSASSLLLDSLEAHGVVVVRRAAVLRLWTNE